MDNMDPLVWTVGVFVAAAIGLRLLYQFFLPKPIKGIPYYADSANRISGDLPRVRAEYEVDKEVSATRYAHCKQLGSPIIQLFLSPTHKPYVFIDDPREVEDILLRRNKEFERSTISRDTIGVIMPHCTIAKPTTQEWRTQRRLWQDIMAPDFLRQVLGPRIHHAAMGLVELWKLKTHNVGGSPIDVTHDFETAALDAIWAAILGQDLGGTEEKISRERPGAHMFKNGGVDMMETLRIMDNAIMAIHNALIPPLANWLLKNGRRFRTYNNVRRNEIYRVMRDAVTRFQDVVSTLGLAALDGEREGFEHDTCAMDLVLRRKVLAAQKAGIPLPDPTKDPALRDELMLLLWAGHDTTSNTLSWWVKYMTNFPEAQERLRKELRKAFPGPEMPDASQIIESDIPYLDGAIEEALRLSATTGRVNRVTKVDAVVLGHVIPAGTECIMSGLMTERPVPVAEELRSPSCRAAFEKRPRGGIEGSAGDDLPAYKPERWLAPGEDGSEVFDANALPRLAFGDGTRGCFGRRLAIQELRIMMVLVILNFEFESLPDHLNDMRGHEKMFRKPEQCFVRLRDLSAAEKVPAAEA